MIPFDLPLPLIVVSALSLAVTVAIVLWIRRKDRRKGGGEW